MTSGHQPFVEKALEGDDSVDEEDLDSSWDDVAEASQPASQPTSQATVPAPGPAVSSPPAVLTAPPEARPTVMMPAVDLAALARLASEDPERR